MIYKAHKMFFKVLTFSLLITGCSEKNASVPVKKEMHGKLFIIGGGEKTPLLMSEMLRQAGISPGDYIAVLPMSSEEPDTAFLYFSNAIRKVSQVNCVNLAFTEVNINNTRKLDSLAQAKLIFITGGDQERFMKLVKNSPVALAIHNAYQNGALVGGTSAGAAVMSKVMITGDQNFSPEYSGTYDKLWKENAIYAEGLGLVERVVVDQHFVARSRYNRLLSALCDYPGMMGIGIDEETAVIVSGDSASVCGDGQVIIFHPVDTCNVYDRHLGMKNVRIDILLSGDQFRLP